MKDDKTIDYRRMASVGNGHLATVVYNDSVFLNGLYNGRLGESRRARIPAEINVRVNFPPRGNQQRDVFRRYKLDMENGYWEENTTVKEATVTQRIYAHQYYNRLLVVEITAQRQGGATGNIVMHLNLTRGPESDDIQFSPKQDFEGGNWARRGVTIAAETDEEHDKPTPVSVYWSEIPSSWSIESGRQGGRLVLIMSVDADDDVARESYESGTRLSSLNPGFFFSSHVDAWRDKWRRGGVEVVGDTGLEKLAYSSFYYLLSSLPTLKSDREPAPFYGLSPGGLAHGGRRRPPAAAADGDDDGGGGRGEQGHVTWEMEAWMLPPVLAFHPELAKSMLSYRLQTTMDAAMRNAESEGKAGLLYAPQSARTGADVSPPPPPSPPPRSDGCADCRGARIHVTGDVAFAARLYVSATRDRLWLEQDGGCDMLRGIAAYWVVRAEKVDKTGAYEIRRVAGLDGDAVGRLVDNSAYTNALANLAINFARYAACMCSNEPKQLVPDSWLSVAAKLKMEYNASAKHHQPYQNYDRLPSQQRRLQNVEPVYLGYPLMWNMSKAVRRNDLLKYEKELSDNAPSTSLSMLAVGWLEVDDRQRANDAFERAYRPYILEPFKVWTDRPGGSGVVNHLPGMGAFLQALIFGYGGLRVRVEYVEMSPKLPPGVTSMKFVDLDYLGATFTVRVTEDRVDVELLTMGLYPLSLEVTATQQTFQLLAEGNSNKASFKRGRFVIHSSTPSSCSVPRDRITNLYQAAQSSEAAAAARLATTSIALAAAAALLKSALT